MTYVFSEKDKADARHEKKVLFWSWFAGLVAVLAVIVTLVVVANYLVSELRNRDYTVLMGFIAGVLLVGYACFSLFFFALKYRLTYKFVKMLKDMDKGLKDEFDAKFVSYDDSISMKDGVFFYTMVLKTKPLRRDDIDERKLLVEHTLPKIELNEGAKLRLVSHANILVAYEITDPSPADKKGEKL